MSDCCPSIGATVCVDSNRVTMMYPKCMLNVNIIISRPTCRLTHVTVGMKHCHCADTVLGVCRPTQQYYMMMIMMIT